jgi:hypothetical protein
LAYQTQEELQVDESIGEEIAERKLGAQNKRATCLRDFWLPPRCRCDLSCFGILRGAKSQNRADLNFISMLHRAERERVSVRPANIAVNVVTDKPDILNDIKIYRQYDAR